MKLFKKKIRTLTEKEKKEAKKWKMSDEEYLQFQKEADIWGLSQFEKEEAVALGFSPDLYYEEMYEDD